MYTPLPKNPLKPNRLNPAAKRWLITVLSAAIAGVAAAPIIPPPLSAALLSLSTFLLGGAHVRRPGDTKP